jgi:anti-sigma factor RsiW
MKCNHPPPLTPDQLSDAIDGKAGAAVQDHLANCPSCAQRLAAARLAEEKLGLKLFRWDCPPSQQLGDYEQGLLDAPEAASIADHLAECARCTQELVAMRQFMSMPERPLPSAPPQPARRGPSLGELIAQLLPRSLAPALRGEVRPPLTAQAEGVTIVLDVQAGEGEQISLQGQVAADDQDRWTGALVTLRQAEELKATAVVDDLGGFSIARLAPAPTDIRLTPQDGKPVLLKGVNLTA